MSGGVGRVLRNSSIYAVGNLALKAFNFFVIPIYTYYLSSEEYGQLSILNNFTSVMVFVIGMSLYSAVMRFYIDYKDDKEKVREYFGTVLIFVFFSGIVVAIILFLGRAWLQKMVFGTIPFFPVVITCIIALVFCSMYTMYQSILRTLELAVKYIIFSGGYFVIHLISLFVLVGKYKMGIEGVMLAQLISYSICSFIMFIDLCTMGYFRFRMNLIMLKASLAYSIPLIPHNLSTQITQLVSKIFIQTSRSYSELGVYNFANQIGSITDLIQSSVSMAIQPWFYSVLSKNETLGKKYINQLIKWLLLIYFALFTGVVIFSQEIIMLLSKSEEYYEAWKIIPYIILVYVIKVPYYFYINVLFYFKKTSKYIFAATLLSSGINVTLSYFLVELWGMYGSIVADIVAMLFRVGAVILLSVFSSRSEIDFRQFIKFLMLFIVTCVLGSIINYQEWTRILLVAIKGMLLVSGMFICLKIYRVQIKELWSYSKTFLTRRDHE